MDSDLKQNVVRVESHINDKANDNNTASDELLRLTSELSIGTTASTMSSASDMANIDELEHTVIEVSQGVVDETLEYNGLDEKLKQLLDEKVEVLRKEITVLRNNNERMSEENNNLQESYRIMEAEKDAAINIIKEKDELIATQKAQMEDLRNAVDIKVICAKRKTTEFFKTKVKRRTGTGSAKQVQINTCEYPTCGAVDADLAMCSSCGRYVCENCNEVPVSKLKAVAKVCNTVHFLCKDCSSGIMHGPETDSNLNCNKSTSSLRGEISAKIKIIESSETRNRALNDLLNDRNDVIESQKTIIENNKIELHNIKEKLKNSNEIIMNFSIDSQI